MKEQIDQETQHNEFAELCALYGSGSLTEAQVSKFERHIAGCADCQNALQQYQQIESMGFAALAPELATSTLRDVDGDSTSLFRKITVCTAQYQRSGALAVAERTGSCVVRNTAETNRERKLSRRVVAMLPYAAAILLTVPVGLYCYRIGLTRVAVASAGQLHQMESSAGSLQSQVGDLVRERDALRATLQDDLQTIDVLTEKIKVQQNSIAALEKDKLKFAELAQAAENNRAASESQREAASRRLSDAQESLAAAQHRLELARQEQAGAALRASGVEKQITDLSASLKERDVTVQEQAETIQQQRDMLAYDRDIRDLIGARDLYVAEVNDVDRDGETRKPFGRVFFTRGKSLVFYAYDLDNQMALRRASTFQAWGRRGADFGEALPLGILYLDNSSNKRWVVRFDDPKALAKIDAVFITLEPKGGSQRPSGKPLLFAYLKVEPNHP
jgi:DNA repair exonuclease SbcCD ATPase subunit